MAQPQSYTPSHSFVADEATNPNFPGAPLDVEFANIKTTLQQILANLAVIQRDDGALANGAVGIDQLDATLKSAFAGSLVVPNASDLAWIAPVRVATTANITLVGLQAIDGVTVAGGDRVLVKNQSDPTQNGIYIVSTGAWTRAPDANTNSQLVQGRSVLVAQGAANLFTRWTLSTANPIAIGLSAITWRFMP